MSKFILNKENLKALERQMKALNWLKADDKVISAEKPGEGNMNYTLRISTRQGTWILKQSRDYVEKYPHIPAPEDRVIQEGRFYQLTEKNHVLRTFTPRILGLDQTNHLLLEEDLGEAADYSWLYKKGGNLESSDLNSAIDFLSELHNSIHPESNAPLANREMRLLNAEHIFRYPFLPDNGFNLDQVFPGLQEVSLVYKHNQALKIRAFELQEAYLEDGLSLQHGDYYPGSWLKTEQGFKVIDPEFCFFGRPEFDLSVLAAHLIMSQQPDEMLGLVDQRYIQPEGFQEQIYRQFTGIEIMRRLIGLAQLPLDLDLEEREEMLEWAFGLVMS